MALSRRSWSRVSSPAKPGFFARFQVVSDISASWAASRPVRDQLSAMATKAFRATALTSAAGRSRMAPFMLKTPLVALGRYGQMIHYTSPDGLSRLGLLLAGGRQAAHGAERGGAQRPVKIGGIDHIDRQGEGRGLLQVGEAAGRAVRSEERRVGKEGGSTGRSRWSTYN